MPFPFLLSLGGAASAPAQGTIAFYNHITSVVVTHVYLGGDHQIAGNGPDDFPAGSQDWAGFTPLAGTGYTAQLWAAPGPDQPEGSPQPTLPTTTFLTVPGAAGTVLNGGNVQIPGVDGGTATITMRVWDNRGDTVTSWAMAEAAGVALGESPLFNSQPLTAIGPPAVLVGLVSFNIYQVPEPSALGLAGMGAVLLWWIWRRRLAGRGG